MIARTLALAALIALAGCHSSLRVRVHSMDAEYLNSPKVVAFRAAEEEREIRALMSSGELDRLSDKLTDAVENTVSGPAFRDALDALEEPVDKLAEIIGLPAASRPAVQESIRKNLPESIRETILADGRKSVELANASFSRGLQAMTDARATEAELKPATRTNRHKDEAERVARARIAELHHIARGEFAGGRAALWVLQNNADSIVVPRSERLFAEEIRNMFGAVAKLGLQSAQNVERLKSAEFKKAEEKVQELEGQLKVPAEATPPAGQPSRAELQNNLIEAKSDLEQHRRNLEAATADAIKAQSRADLIHDIAAATKKPDLAVGTDLIDAAADAVSAVNAIADTVGDTIQQEVAESGIVGKLGILDDPMASLIVYAPEENWEGVYNEAFGRNTLGNSDIAIIMDGPGQFTIKGVRMDGGEVAAATFTVLKQTIQVAAAVSGVPIPTFPGQGETTSSNPNADANIIATRSAAKAAADAKVQATLARQQRLILLDTIISQGAILDDANATKDQVDASLATIRRMLQSARSSLPQAASKE